MKTLFAPLTIGLLFTVVNLSATLGDPPIDIQSRTTRAGLGDELRLTLPATGVEDGSHKIDQLVLFIEGRELKNLHPVGYDAQTRTAIFKLARKSDDIDAWNSLIGSPHGYTAKWGVSIGYDGIGPISKSVPIMFIVLHENAWYVCIALLAALLVAMVYLTLYTGMLRDPDGYYSLGRTQMLFWFFLVVAAFGYIWLITADRNVTVPNQVLALIGISATTGLAAGFIDDDKRNKSPGPGGLAAAPAAVAAAAAGGGPAAVVVAAPPLPAPAVAAAAGPKITLMGRVKKFIHDLLCSGESIDLHRFQIFIWTLLLGLVFIRSVYVEMAMPAFDTTLLTLMGISSGTYIGFKFREQ